VQLGQVEILEYSSEITYHKQKTHKEEQWYKTRLNSKTANRFFLAIRIEVRVALRDLPTTSWKAYLVLDTILMREGRDGLLAAESILQKLCFSLPPTKLTDKED
jgi:hypothetical protein